MRKPIDPNLTLSIDDSFFLRIPNLKEAEELFQLVDKNREHLREFLGWVDATTSVNDTRVFLSDELDRLNRNEILLLALWYQKKLIGLVDLHNIDHTSQSTFIGYWLDKEHQGKGLMTRAIKTLIDYAFTTLKLHRIQISCAIHNIRSQAIPNYLGFQREGILKEAIRHDRESWDAILYTLISNKH